MLAQRAAPAFALAAALLFGLSAPAAKLLVGTIDPWLVAGLLYLGSGLGLGLYRVARRFVRPATNETALAAHDLPWLGGAILAGGIAGPVLLMFALAWGAASQAALLLNLEGVFTVLLAWVVFGEHVHARIATGMAAIAAGAMVLTWGGSGPTTLDWSAVLVAGACLAWAVDNNLTRRVSAADPVQIAALKGVVAGGVNVLVAVARGAEWPPAGTVLSAALVGLGGYGTSLVLFVLALRHLGAARTGAYFGTAPFVGALGGVLALREAMTPYLLVAGVLMAVGVWLSLTERHAHEHVHGPLEHEHLHWHDEHHQHDHPSGAAAHEPHTHWHAHGPLRHGHPHWPDLHHRHQH
jgi:drug/metabolite transporter (DMT)-like permease